jgi:hypothetical protein
MLVLKSVWLWIHSVLWPSYTYEAVGGSSSLNLTSSTNNNNSFQVLGVGLSRTGTFSTRIALTSLLGGKCYHGYVSSLDGEPEFWQRASNGLLTDQDWIDGLEGRGYTAGVGEPVNLFYPELLRIFPRAKVILTTRPGKDWVRSMRRAIIEPRSYLERPPISWLFSFFGITQAKQSIAEVRSRMATKWGFNYSLWSSVEAGDKEALSYFETWNAKVVQSVPKERLLVYNVEDGWEPLAKFLNVDPPTGVPFPRINDADTVRLVVKGGYWLLILGLPFMCLLCCTCKIRRRLLERSCIKAMSIIRQTREYYNAV